MFKCRPQGYKDYMMVRWLDDWLTPLRVQILYAGNMTWLSNAEHLRVQRLYAGDLTWLSNAAYKWIKVVWPYEG